MDYVLSMAPQSATLGRHAALNLVFEFEFGGDALPETCFKGFVRVLRVVELGLRLRWRSYVSASTLGRC